jgi:Mg/Co/Ni transporter MgtE
LVLPTLNHAFNRDRTGCGRATLVDVTGLIIYFSIALVIMRGVML